MGIRISKDHLHPSVIESITSLIGDLNQLETTAKGNAVEAINELLANGGNKEELEALIAEIAEGKELIANAVGEPLTAEESFDEMSNDINGLLSTFKTNMMNNGVTVESNDRFKTLIDKIATMVEEGEGKGVKFASGDTIEINYASRTDYGTVKTTINTNLNFTPNYVFVCVDTLINSKIHKNVVFSNLYKTQIAGGTLDGTTVTITDIRQESFKISVLDSSFNLGAGTWYAIGVGEEDTTLRDSLSDILEDKGVDVTEEDDMASLISKVDSIKVNNMPDWLVTNEWYQKVASKTLTNYAMTGSVKDIIYTIGGGDLSSASKIFNCFLPASNTWSTRAALPSGVTKAQTAVYDDNYIYCFGGRGNSSNLKTNYCYDYSLDTWTTKANMASSEFDGAGAILDTTIYCIGGSLSDNANRTYDILTNTWSTKTVLPATRDYCEAVGFNGFVYVYGGSNGLYSQSTMYAYDPSIDTWTAKADGGIDRLDHVMVVIKDRIYCSGGQDGGTSLRYYNPVTDSWTTKAKLPVDMGGVGTRGAAYNGILYHFGSSNLLTYIPD